MAESHFVILKKEQIGRLTEGSARISTADDAVQMAGAQTTGDREPRYVVQVLHLIEIDPKPNVIVKDIQEVASA